MNEFSWPLAPGGEGNSDAASSAGAAPRSRGGAPRWEIVARMPGLAAATIVASRLEMADIPVRVWQEAAGQAFGLLVGVLGTGFVAVPEPYAERALAILEEPPPSLGDEDQWHG